MPLEGAYAFDDVGSTTVLDLSGNGRHIALTGTTGAQVDGSAVLDAGALGKTGADTVSLPAALLTACETDDRTIMFDAVGGRGVWWVRFESTALDTGVWGLLSLDSTSIIVRARNQANSSPTPGAPTVGALAATRHNFAITYVRATGVVSYYYDGALVGTSTFTPGTALYTGADDLNIAEWSSTGPALDNLRFFSHALTPSEVADLAGTPVVTPVIDVTGTAMANLGTLTGAAIGTRVTVAVMTAALAGPTATATGTRTVSGTSAVDLGGLTATGSGTRVVVAQAVATLGGLTATVTGLVTSPGTATAPLGNLTATAVATRATAGSARANLGALIATVVKAAEVTAARVRVSGREPYRSVSGREPRDTL